MSATPKRDYGEGLPPGGRDPAPYEAGRGRLRGRQFKEEACPTRSPFQRDRDRVLHSTAFRRLTHKTQVFIYHEGDHYRSRLTHSLEVAQIARTLARQLRLNEDLAECLSLAHDLGHPPFGHAGERALDEMMQDYGGFDHNAQSLRIVMRLEQKYTAFRGLNLSWEVLEGLAKHNGPIEDQASPVAKVLSDLSAWQDFELGSWPSAEAQVAALSDDIAYLTHDIDDGLRAGLICIEDLRDVPLAGEIIAGTARDNVTAEDHLPYEIVRRLITILIDDVVTESRARLRALSPESPDGIRAAGRPMIGFSAAAEHQIKGLRSFLFAQVYRSDRVMRVMQRAQGIVTDLFARYMTKEGFQDLPAPWSRTVHRLQDHQRPRLISDYLAGMTDRFAHAEHRRLFDASPDLR